MSLPSSDTPESPAVEPNLVQIQREIDSLRKRIGAFYEQSTPADADEEEERTNEEDEQTRSSPSIRTSFESNNMNTSSPPSAEVRGKRFVKSQVDAAPPAIPNTSSASEATNTTSISPIIKKETKYDPTTAPPAAIPTTDNSNLSHRYHRFTGNANSPFTTKVSNFRLIIKGNTQLDARNRSAPPTTRHHLASTFRHHSSSNKPSAATSPITSTTTSATTSNPSLPDSKSIVDNTLDMVVCTPKQEKPETSTNHVAKKQKLALKGHSRNSPEFVAKLEVEQYMMEETLEELYQLVVATKKQVVLDLANTSVSLTDFQGRVLQQLKVMESKCRAQQKQHQVALVHPKSETKSEGTNQLQDSLDLEKAKVASLEYTVEELQAKTKELDALLTERDASLSELLRQLHESGAEPRINLPPAVSSSPLAPLSRAASDVDPADTDVPPMPRRDVSSQMPTLPPVLLPCHPPTDNEQHQEQPEHQPHQPTNSDNLQPPSDQTQVAALNNSLAQQERLHISLTNKDRELKELQQQLSQLQATIQQQNEKSHRLDQLRVTQQASLLSFEATAKDLKLQTDQLRHSLQEKTHQNNILVQQNAQLEQEIKELESHAHNLQMLNQHLQAQEQSLNAQNQSLKAQHQKLQVQHGELRKICYDQDHTIADLTGTLGSLQAQVQGLKVQLEQVEQHVQLHSLVTSQKLQPQPSQPQPSPPKQPQQLIQTPQAPHEDSLNPPGTPQPTTVQLQEPQEQQKPQLEENPQEGKLQVETPQQEQEQPQPQPQLPPTTIHPPQEPQEKVQEIETEQVQRPLPIDINESAQKLDNIQQHAEEVRNKYSVNTDDVEEVQRIIQELEKIFLETFTEISRLRNILLEEGISPTPLPTLQ